MVTEGSYPIRTGGLSTLAHFLIRAMNNVRFHVYAVTSPEFTKPTYPKLPNVASYIIAPLMTPFPDKAIKMPAKVSAGIARSMQNTLYGTPLDLEVIVNAYKYYGLDKSWLLSRECWDSIIDYYSKNAPDEPFVDSYWNIFNLYALVFDILSVLPKLPKADIYHALSAGHAGIISALGKLLYKRSFILTEQGLYLIERQQELSRQDITEFYRSQHMRFAETIVKTVYKYSDRVVPPSSRHVAIETGLGLPIGKIKIIRNGIEVDKFVPGPLRNGSIPAVGCFARVVSIKGIEVLIEAARIILEKQKADFFVLGEVQEEDYYQECLKLVERVGIGDRFKFMGHVNTLDWYRKVDIFTLSSHSEGVPYALLEAMSCGLPSVCTAVGGVPDILTDGTGYLVPPNQPEQLADKLGLLIADRDLRRQMGEKASRVANEKYDVRDMAANFEKLYREVIDERQSAGN